MNIYDEENYEYADDDDDMAGYSLINEHSIFKTPLTEPDPETIASPIPENEQTVLLCDPKTTLVPDGAALTFTFGENDTCAVLYSGKQIGTLKPAFVQKFKAERAAAPYTVFFKKTVPPMIRIVY